MCYGKLGNLNNNIINSTNSWIFLFPSIYLHCLFPLTPYKVRSLSFYISHTPLHNIIKIKNAFIICFNDFNILLILTVIEFKKNNIAFSLYFS